MQDGEEKHNKEEGVRNRKKPINRKNIEKVYNVEELGFFDSDVCEGRKRRKAPAKKY